MRKEAVVTYFKLLSRYLLGSIKPQEIEVRIADFLTGI
jgi:hypothetical protein